MFPPEQFGSLYPFPLNHPCDRQSQVRLRLTPLLDLPLTPLNPMNPKGRLPCLYQNKITADTKYMTLIIKRTGRKKNTAKTRFPKITLTEYTLAKVLGTAKPLRSPARARLCPGLGADIIPELSTKDPLLMNRSQIALIVNTDSTDTSAVFCSQLQPL